MLIFRYRGPPLATNVSAGSFTPDFWISATGSDSNDGLTSSTPWAITALNTKQATYAGHSVGLMDGTYNVFSLYAGGVHDGYTPLLQIKGGPNNSSRTIIRAVNARQAIIHCNNGATFGTNDPVMGDHGASQQGNITVDGIVFDGYSSKGLYFGSYIGVGDSTRFANYTVQNNEFKNQNGSGLSYGNNLSSLEFAQCTDGLIYNNYFHDNVGYFPTDGSSTPHARSDHHSATLQWICQRMVYRNNTLIRSGPIYGKEDGSYGTTIENNYLQLDQDTDANMTGIYDFAGGGSAGGISTVIRHNVVIAPKAMDLRPTLGGAGFGDPVSIYSNTVVVLDSAQSGGIMVRAAAGNLSMYDNIIYSQANGDLDLLCVNVDADGIADYDLYYSTTGTYVYGTFSSVSDNTRSGTSTFTTWQSTMGGTPESHSVRGSDPVFVNTGSRANLYKISGGPASGVGKSDGTSGGSACDIGAWGNGAPSTIGSDF